MPPKKAAKPAKASGKTVQKQREKIVEDKTFGLKNKKKSAKVQKYVHSVEKQVDEKLTRKLGKPVGTTKVEKKKEQEEQQLSQINKVVASKQPDVAAGVDPKSVLCQYFKAGNCKRGKLCKFSHDLAVERKAEKIDLYTDPRDVKGERETKSNDTGVVCKFFLEAVKAKKYGWFWVCPNEGNECPYRHALPEGFVLQEDEKKEEGEDLPIEELIEQERKLLTQHTPLTLELFLEWKKKKKLAEEAVQMSAAEKRREDIKTGKIMMSGREIFVANPDLFVDDDAAMEDEEIEKLKEEEEAENLNSNIPQNIIEVTETSVTLRPKIQAKGKENYIDLQGVRVNIALFVDDPDLPVFEEEDEDYDSDEDDDENLIGDDDDIDV